MKGQDINQLYASGNNAQVTALMTKIMGRLTNVEVALLKHSPEVSILELSFLSSGGFPKEIFRQITSSIQFSYGLYIKVMTDQIGKDYNEEHIFQNDIWNFEIRPSLKRHNSKGTYYTTGAYIEPISYTNSLGKTVYGWIVSSFEADTFCDGDYVDVSDYATFLDGLTPPADEEDRKTEYIIQSLQSFDFQRIELGLYKAMLEDVPSSVYIRQLDDISYAGHITQIESTLDTYLIDSPHFSQTLREILVDIFGRDRRDIFLTDENALVIGCCRANIWMIQEHFHKYIPSEEKKSQRPDVSPSLVHYSFQMQELAHKDLEEIRQHLKANGMIKDIEQSETYTAFYKDKNGKAVAAEYTSVEIVQSGEIYIGLTDGHIICEPQFTMSNIFDIFSIIQENHGTYQK